MLPGELSAGQSHFRNLSRVGILSLTPELQQNLCVSLHVLGDFKNLVAPSNSFRNFGA